MPTTERYYLGEISARYESGGAGAATISSGRGDKGGASYGVYQLSSAEGTLARYLAWSSYKGEFEGLAPATAAFDKKWRELAGIDPAFAADQRNFIRSTHYDLQMERLKQAGLDLSGRGPAVQEAVFSTSVQFGSLTRSVFSHGLTEAFGNDKIDGLSDKDIVQAVQDYKIRHVAELFQSSPSKQESIVHRARSEKEDLVALAEGQPLPERHLSARHASPVLKQGSRGPEVVKLQRGLGELGYLLDPDGKFGPDTRDAVTSFQREHGLAPDGIVGSATSGALERVSAKLANAGRSAEPICLDHPSHPDHAFYRQTHTLVCELDRQHGRTPDLFSSNLASALVVSGRQGGLARIDRLALDDHGAVVWGAQNLPGSPLAEKFCQVDALQALNTPMEQSAARWNGAMQEYTRQEASAVQSQLPASPAHAVMATRER